ncbi:G patch domain-containing protein 4, partial [Megalops cyprinoides]|uniref:G patch domain-containing protein 4 n=1 Tax=Megalops cyprinoides TaxID=118141 RepID=UPI00186470A9
MAEEVEKSRGLKFAEQQLLRHGWEQGKGLGREENGISEAIKVKVKCDKGGVGHNQGEQFTFHWWDHIFNKASANLVVESGQDGVKVKQVAGEGEEGMISNKKPRKAELAKAKLYGRFIKSATLWSGEEQSKKQLSTSEDSSGSEDEDKRLDLSSTTKLSDNDLMKACGGRTAHKGARHGLTMSAKLARLEQQEQEFLTKYGRKNQPTETLSREMVSNSAAQSSIVENKMEENEGKKAKKKKKHTKDKMEKTVEEDKESTTLSETKEVAVIPKIKKKRSKDYLEETVGEDEESKEVDVNGKKKKKRSKEKHEAVVERQPDVSSSNKKESKKRKHSYKEKTLGEGNCHFDSEVTEDDGRTGIKEAITVEGGEGAVIPEQDIEDNLPKKKKHSTHKEEVSVGEAGEYNCGSELNDAETVIKKKRKTKNATNVPECKQEEENKMEEGQKIKKKK